jgi:hypothetical protein
MTLATQPVRVARGEVEEGCLFFSDDAIRGALNGAPKRTSAAFKRIERALNVRFLRSASICFYVA